MSEEEQQANPVKRVNIKSSPDQLHSKTKVDSRLLAVASADVLARWREQLLRAMMYGGFIIGIIAIITTIPDDIKTNNFIDLIVIGVALVILLIAMLARLPYWLRAGAILFILYDLSLSGLLQNGTRGDGPMILLVGSILALMFFGTRAISTSAEVSRRLSTILDRDQLVLAVVEEVQRAFNYYHAKIYLLDDAHQNLLLVGGTGEAGQAMLSQGHKIPKGKGIVGRTAESNQIILVPDTRVDPGWLPNPLLPETKSELAVPIATGERVLGVLDVQYNIVNGLSQQDAELLQSIANQVAVALQNVVLFAKTQRQAEHETLVNTVTQQLQTATTIDRVLQVLARELGIALHAQRVTAQLSNWTKSPQEDNR